MKRFALLLRYPSLIFSPSPTSILLVPYAFYSLHSYFYVNISFCFFIALPYTWHSPVLIVALVGRYA